MSIQLYKLLIADDELPVVGGLTYLIEKNFPGTFQIFTASSGPESLEKAREHHPELIIMDVMMPGFNGLTALREIRKHLPQAIFVLLTAYERFDIAEEGINIGIFHYLLKSLETEKMLGVLRQCLYLLQEERKRKQSETRLLGALEMAKNILEPLFLSRFLTPQDPERAQYIKTLWSWGQSGAWLFVVEPGSGARDQSEKKWLDFRLGLKYKFHLLLGEGLPLWGLIPGESGDKRGEELRRFILQWNGEPTWRFYVSEFVPWQDLGNQVGVLQAQLHPVEPQTVPHSYPWAQESLLWQSLEGQRWSEFLLRLLPFLRLVELCYPDRTRYREVLGQWKSAAIRFIIFHFPFHDPETLVADLREKFDPDDLFAFFRDLIKLSEANPVLNQNPLIEKVTLILKSRFKAMLSLEDVAHEVGVSSAYLSRLFSEECGESFVDYLTKVRVQKAKELLREGLSVKEVSSEAGYTDPNYFSRLFKKIEGMTPTDFAKK